MVIDYQTVIGLYVEQDKEFAVSRAEAVLNTL